MIKSTLLYIKAEVMEPDVAILPDGARQLAEAKSPPEADGVNGSPHGLSQDDLRREVVDAPLRITAFMGPVPPKLVILDKLPMLRIDALALRAAHDIRVEHAALDGKPTFRQVLPGVPLRNG